VSGGPGLTSGAAPAGSSRRLVTVLVTVLALVAAVAAGWWAARATLEPQGVEGAGSDSTVGVVWAEATEGSVGRSLPLSTTLRQPSTVVAVNQLSGVVTQASPGQVDVGEVLYAVAGVPVRAVEGAVPFYRDLSPGVRGVDVEQLQAALVELGYLEGEPDGVFGPDTEAAVEDWQDDLRIPETGTVTLGELVAVASLPTVVQLGESIATGRVVGGGEEAVLAPTGEREFVLVVTADQARLIPAEATVEVTWQELTWTGVIAGSVQDEFGNTEFELTAPDGGPVCGEECESLPGDAQVTLRSEVVVVPRVEGVTVPAAAVRTRADGTVYVTTQDGEIAVQVRASGGGVAVVDGVEAGTRVQVLGEAPPGTAPGQDGAEATGGR
jgi:peptidoglycan hydrolase-like protein with peptidoglycan-binding domain